MPDRTPGVTKSNLEVLAYEESPLGMICLRRRELLSIRGTVVTEITLDHELLVTSYHTASERALATCGLERHPGAALHALIGGLGLGYTAFEALQSPRVARVEVVAQLPQVIDWLLTDQVPLSSELNGDERFEVVPGDIYALLAAPAERRFDLILVDVDHSPEERLSDPSADFYLTSGLRLAKAHLAEGGVLGVWSYAESSSFADDLRKVFARVDVETVTFDNRLIEERETSWLFLARD
jgi:spermidine synthase